MAPSRPPPSNAEEATPSPDFGASAGHMRQIVGLSRSRTIPAPFPTASRSALQRLDDDTFTHPSTHISTTREKSSGSGV